MPPLPALNAGLRNKRMSSIGSSTRISHATNAASTTIAMANAPRVGPLLQPCSGAWMRPYTSCAMPTIESTAPIGIERRLLGVARRGTRNRPPTSASAMIGTLTRNTEPYQKWPSRKPLATGPIAPAPPVVAAQMAIALVRSCGGNTLTRIDSVDGMISAAPAPISARQAISCSTRRSTDASAAPTRKIEQAELQRALAPEAVAERAGR